MNTPDQDDVMPGSELSEPADEDWDSDPREDVGSDTASTSLVEEVTEKAFPDSKNDSYIDFCSSHTFDI